MSVRHRPPTCQFASRRANVRLSDAIRLAAAMPAAPAPTIAISTSPEAGTVPRVVAVARAVELASRVRRVKADMGREDRLWRFSLPEATRYRKRRLPAPRWRQ